MLYKGKMCWIPSDVMTHLYDGRNPSELVADVLREVLDLDAPEPVIVAERARVPYDVSMLEVGEELLFTGAKQDAMVPSVRKQADRLGRVFSLNVTDRGCQVIRTK